MKKAFLIAGIIVAFYACKKEKTVDPTDKEQVKSEYLPMTVGNYWIYQEFDIDNTGTETETSRIDSTVITKDTTINLRKFYKYITYRISSISEYIIDTRFCSDSCKNLINPLSIVKFSETNLTDTIFRYVERADKDIRYKLTGKMERNNSSVTVPSGTFSNVLNFMVTVCYNYGSYANKPLHLNNYYAKQIGKILFSSAYSTGDIIESRLIRYRIIQ